MNDLLLAEIAYYLMTIWLFMMKLYFVAIFLIVIFIVACKLENDFKKWVFKGGREDEKDLQ